jgi:hypothetical protein
VVLVTVFTANLSAFLIGSSSEDDNQDTRKLNQKSELTLQDVMKRLDRIERMLQDQKNKRKRSDLTSFTLYL